MARDVVLIVALLQDGPCRGQRREIETDQYGRVPAEVIVTASESVRHRYLLVGASSRAREWLYRHDAEPAEAVS